MKDWTFEEARAAQNAYEAAGGNPGDPSAPLYQWVALQKIEQLKSAYDDGYSFALLDAVAQCALRDLVMPDWVWRGFLDRFRSVTQFKVKTLDEAFGTCLPKNAKLSAHRQAREKGLSAYFEVERQHKAGDPIDERLFQSVGKTMGISGSKIRDYYYIWKRRLTYKKTPE
jgi:hypothetical protein